MVRLNLLSNQEIYAMPEYYRSMLLKEIRRYLGIQQYPMSVYLNVLYQTYIDWEAEKLDPPQAILDIAESWNKLPNLSREKQPEQWQARRDDMKERSDRGETYGQIGEMWGVSPPRVWQIINQSEDAPMKVVKEMMNNEEKISPEIALELMENVRQQGLSESTQRYLMDAIHAINKRK